MRKIVTNLKRLLCGWFGHVWRVRIERVTSLYALRHDFCNRCGIRENWQLVMDEEG